MKAKPYLAIFSFCLVLISNLSAQSQAQLFQELKSKTDLLDQLYGEIQQRKAIDQVNKLTKAREINLLKLELSALKQEIKKSNPQQLMPAYQQNLLDLDQNFELLDFYMYDWDATTYRIVARLRCKTKIYSDFVKLRYNFYKNNNFITTDYTYIDFESYGYAGMLPYHISFLETFTDKADFDSIAFEISYWTEDGDGDILWDQILELESSRIIQEGSLNRWVGVIKNKSNYSVKFPKIFASIFKDENMIDIDYTYLDVQNDSLPPNTTGTFDSYIDLPDDYNKIKYYLSYWLYSLEGSGNITSNLPTFTQLTYSGSERTSINFDMFLIDHEDDQIEVQMDWDDNSNLTWQGPFYSRNVATLNHNFSQAGVYYLRSKSKDGTNSETDWSDSLKVEILPVPELKITTKHLKDGIYKNVYRDTVTAVGGISPYQWRVSSGNLPDGLNINSITGEIAGVPSVSGSFSLSIMVTDGGNPSVSDEVNFQIIINNNPPRIISANSLNIAEHEELMYTARAIDPDGNVVSFNFENYPIWLTVSDSIIAGIVPEGAKDTSFMVIAFDGELSDTLNVSVNVIPVNDPPIITSPDSVSAIEDSVFKYTARAFDPEDSLVTYKFKDYPLWLSPLDSIISGIPLEGAQDTSFLVIAFDGELNDSLLVRVTVTPINDPPQLISVAIDTAYEHSLFKYTAKAIDPEGDIIFYSFDKFPTWLTPVDSTISGTPPEGAKDTSFMVVAFDGKLDDTLEVALKVIPVNDPPQIVSPDNVNAYEDLLFTYTAKAVDPENDKITYIFEDYPTWLTPSDSIISGIPKEGTEDSSFIVIANDGKLSDSMQVSITVTPVNDPPELISAKIDTAYEDLTFIYEAKAIDPENDKILYSFINYPEWLTPSDSIISGIPKEGATDTSFIVIASDNVLSDSLSVTLIVIPINDPPQIVNLSNFSFKNNETYTINLDTCAVDEDHSPEQLIWQVTPIDSNLHAIISNHILSLTAPNWTGTTAVNFTVTDPEGASDSALVNVTVALPSFVENQEKVIPKEFFLRQNYPNPFNPQTTIHFGIPKFSTVNITIYNLKGEIVKELFRGGKQAGNHFIVWDAKDNPSGVYLIRFHADKFVQIRKCLLLK